MSLTLADLMAPYPRIRLATPDDNRALLKFLSSVSMDAQSFSMRYDRNPDFFAFTRQQGIDQSVFLFLNDDDSIGGMGTVCLRDQYVEGQLVRTGYHCELRTTPGLSRRARIQWRHLYRDLIRHYQTVEDYGGCAFFYTALLRGNRAAEAALARKNRDFVYRPIADYQTGAILGRLPGASWFPFTEGKFRRSAVRAAGLKARPAAESDEPALRRFLQRVNTRLTLGDGFKFSGTSDTSDTSGTNGDEWQRRVASWQGFGPRSFVIVEDSQGKICGSVCPWLQSPGRRLVVENMSTGQKLFGSALPLVGGRTLRSGVELSVLHLTHLEVDPDLEPAVRSGVFELILVESHKHPMHQGCHLMTFRIPDDLPVQEVLWRNGFVYQTSGGTVYQILSPEADEQGYHLPTSSTAPLQFELGIA